MAPHVSVPIERSPRILLVDGDAIALAQLRHRIRTLHPKWMIFAVERAEHALELVRRGGIDVVVTEIDLADPALLELARLAGATTEGPVCIAHASRPDRARSFAGPLHRVLSKPAEDSVLFPAVLSALRLKKEARKCGLRAKSA